MVGRTIDAKRHAVQLPNNAAHVGEETFFQVWFEGRHSVFCAEDDVVMEGEMRGWQGAELSCAPAGARAFSNGNPVAYATG